MRILHAMHDVPFPPRGGGRVDMWGRLRALAGLGHQVDVVLPVWSELSPEIVHEIRRYCGEIIFCRRRPMWQGLFSARPCQVSSRRELATVRLTRTYDSVLLDGDAMGDILDNPSLECGFRILRTHNSEAEYHRERSLIPGSSLPLKLYDRLEARRYPEFSAGLFRNVDAVWWVSVHEMQQACAADPGIAARSDWLPHFHDVKRMHPFTRQAGGKVLLVGALSSTQNIEAVAWYLDQVHPLLRGKDGYEFVVAGGTDNRELSPVLERLASDRSAFVLKDVEDLRQVYSTARLFVNPVQHGAGINSKTIHAISEGLAIVTTTPGYRGTGLEPNRHVLAADSGQMFADYVRRLLEGSLDPENMVREAQEFLRSHYDHAFCLERLLGKLTERGDQGRAGSV